MERHRLEVLHDGGKVELVAGAGETSQLHALEPVVDLVMSKAHFNAFAFRLAVYETAVQAGILQYHRGVRGEQFQHPDTGRREDLGAGQFSGYRTPISLA